MGKASRTKRKRAAVRSAKRARTNNWWYFLTGMVVVVLVALIVYARMTTPTPVGPYILDQANATNPKNRDSHWHAALGVYNCDHWMSDGSGDGVWNWLYATPDQRPARAGNTNVYAGLHSHDDGIIHMEPLASEEAGRHATIGKYFEYGGWKISSTGFKFLDAQVKNGDKCAGKPGSLQWAVASFDGNVKGKQKYTVHTGNPGDFKLHNDDIVILAFLPEGKSVLSLGNPPSLAKLPDAASRDATTNSPATPTPTAGVSPTTTAGTTPATTKKP